MTDDQIKDDLDTLSLNLRRLCRRDERPTSGEIRTLRAELEKYEEVLETEERRAKQIKEMDQHPDEPFDWYSGDISRFSDDLIFHARRLGHDIRGVFNTVTIIATPGSVPREVADQYYRKTKR